MNTLFAVFSLVLSVGLMFYFITGMGGNKNKGLFYILVCLFGIWVVLFLAMLKTVEG